MTPLTDGEDQAVEEIVVVETGEAVEKEEEACDLEEEGSNGEERVRQRK